MESYNGQVYSSNGSFQDTLKYQMSAVAAMLLARKVRVNITDQPGLALQQSLGQLSDKSNPGQLQLVNNNDIQKLSTVENQSNEYFGNCEIFSTFGSSVFHPDLVLQFTRDNSKDAQLSSSSNKSTHADNPESRFTLTHIKPCSHISDLPNTLKSHHKNSSDCLTIRSNYMQSDKSHNDYFEAADRSGRSTVNIKSTSAVSDVKKSTESDNSNSIGFGILSRTRQFGAWLSKATEGGKLEITKQDLNTLAPNSF